MKLLLGIFLILAPSSVFSFPVLSAEQPEVPGETKSLYERVLVKIQLIQGICDQMDIKNPFLSGHILYKLRVEFNALKNTLAKKPMISLMSGFDGKVSEQLYQERMLRIYRRDTMNPFAEKFTLNRLIRFPYFPNRLGLHIRKWNDLMDKGRIAFMIPPTVDKFKDFKKHITKLAIQAVEQEIKKIFEEQTGRKYRNSIENTFIYTEYNIEPFMDIFRITYSTYGKIYANLPRFKITAK